MKKQIEQDKQKVIDDLRAFLAENKIEQKEFADEIKKSESTVSRWMNGEYPISEANAILIKLYMASRYNGKTATFCDSVPDDLKFYTFKARLLNYIMEHPAICQQCKVEAYKAIQEFQPA